ncbi:YrhB domain-containing protein [Nocardia sp. NPDC052566]|uniref:YrhB domain-containing protein n=1 Tax=Nocardia sp. NPDC052566 TaxID=3364330 RepID=UPI0037CC9C37
MELEIARSRAAELLAKVQQDIDDKVIFFDGQFDVPEHEDHGDVWVFNWNSEEFLRTGDFFKQILMGPITVPKDGTPPFFLGTARDLPEELQLWRKSGRS